MQKDEHKHEYLFENNLGMEDLEVSVQKQNLFCYEI